MATRSQRDRRLPANELNAVQLCRGTTGHVDDRALRYARRLADRQALSRAAEVRRIARAHGDRADEGTVRHADYRRISRRAAIGCNDEEIAAHRADLRTSGS